MQNKSRIFEDMGNLVNNTAAAVKGLGDEIRVIGQAQLERAIADMDLIRRDELEVLKMRLNALEAEVASLKSRARTNKSGTVKKATKPPDLKRQKSQ